jgi:hypothetical protein
MPATGSISGATGGGTAAAPTVPVSALLQHSGQWFWEDALATNTQGSAFWTMRTGNPDEQYV